jgi:hypothetical protein
MGTWKFLNTSGDPSIDPLGHPRIARRFNAGTGTDKPLTYTMGRLKTHFVRPSLRDV